MLDDENSSYTFLKLMSVFCPYRYRPDILAYLIILTSELAFRIYNTVLDNFSRLTESLGLPLLDAYISSYG